MNQLQPFRENKTSFDESIWNVEYSAIKCVINEQSKTQKQNQHAHFSE